MKVLILVLVEDGFRALKGSQFVDLNVVLILVLVEDGFRVPPPTMIPTKQLAS